MRRACSRVTVRSPVGRATAAPPGSGWSARSRVSAGRLVDEDGDAVADDLRVDEAQALLVARVAEEPLPIPEHDREDHQPELVDEVVLEERLHEPGTPVDDDVALLLPSQLRDLLRDVSPEDRRVVPR